MIRLHVAEGLHSLGLLVMAAPQEPASTSPPGSTLQEPAAPASPTMLDQIRQGDWSPVIERYLIPAIGALLLMVVAYFLARFLARVGSAPVRKRVDETLGRQMRQSAQFE